MITFICGSVILEDPTRKADTDGNCPQQLAAVPCVKVKVVYSSLCRVVPGLLAIYDSMITTFSPVLFLTTPSLLEGGTSISLSTEGRLRGTSISLSTEGRLSGTSISLSAEGRLSGS